MQLDRQLCLLPAGQALTEDLEDRFDSLIKDFHFAFVNKTYRLWARGTAMNCIVNT